MGKTIYYDKYRKFAKQITKSNLNLLSGRYKFVIQKYKYIYKDILEKLSINKSDDMVVLSNIYQQNVNQKQQLIVKK